MRNILSAGLMLGLAGLAALPAAATPFNNQSISNLSIGGTTYTVTFFDRAFSIPGAGTLASPFTTSTQAFTAVNAIVNSAQYTALRNQANVIGVAATYFTSIIVPFSGVQASVTGDNPPGTQVYLGYGAATPAPPANGFGNFEILSLRDYTAEGLTVATFTQSSNAVVGVPEPASIAVLALGLFGLGWVRRRV